MKIPERKVLRKAIAKISRQDEYRKLAELFQVSEILGLKLNIDAVRFNKSDPYSAYPMMSDNIYSAVSDNDYLYIFSLLGKDIHILGLRDKGHEVVQLDYHPFSLRYYMWMFYVYYGWYREWSRYKLWRRL